MIFLSSNLYIQYHCLALTLTLNKLDSFCHSIRRSMKLEFVKMLIHHIAGTIQAKKSPHLPCER